MMPSKHYYNLKLQAFHEEATKANLLGATTEQNFGLNPPDSTMRRAYTEWTMQCILWRGNGFYSRIHISIDVRLYVQDDKIVLTEIARNIIVSTSKQVPIFLSLPNDKGTLGTIIGRRGCGGFRILPSLPFSFAFSLCNYLSVSDISEVRVEGLETLDYVDNLMNRSRFTEQADAITFDGDVGTLASSKTLSLNNIKVCLLVSLSRTSDVGFRLEVGKVNAIVR
ncbi:unnamed protein product [Trifolium pratense]|uniref:Uncharacterized protein n=1 Tax=Trifolium pratense TaxID=57577 RepID=A0ACB0MF13_TRIPR|nr:unnamed protein product [Trifolium pratense]